MKKKVYGKKIQYSSKIEFSKHARVVSNNLYIFNSSVTSCFQWLYKEWELTFKQYRFFDSDAFVDIEFPCDIATFYDAFNIHCKKMTRALEIKWRHGFMELMLDRAVDAFHFFEQNEKVYEKSRTKKLLRSLNLRMSSMLRYLLEESIADMNAYLKKNGFSTTSNETSNETPNETPNEIKCCPLFLIQLTVRSKCIFKF